MKAIPKIQKFMTMNPHTIGATIPLKEAAGMMGEGRYRHLPVQRAGKLVGILSDRDVKLAASFGPIETLTVEDVMSQDPYSVSPDAPLDEVVSQMAEHRYGSAVVLDHGKVVGIFTAVDGLRAFSEVLQKRFHA